MKVGKWSTTAASNNAAPPDGWPEQQFAATVNDCAREMMAQIRTMAANIEYLDLDNTPSYLSTTSFSLGTADTFNWEAGRRVKLYDTTTLYGTIHSVSGTTVQVRLDSGVLSSSLSSAALGVLRQSSPSLPDAAFQHENVVINGQLDLWQRTASVAGVLSNQYVADCFKWIQNSSASVNMYRDTNVPSIASTGVVLNSSLTVAVSAVDAVVAAGDFAGILYIVEGFDWRQIAHRPLAVSFQAYSNRSGVYALSLRSGQSSASYIQNFTISAINTWTRFFLPIPAAPTSPYTWDYSSGTGLSITWTFMSGTTYQATASEWTAMQAIASSSQVNFLASAGNVFSLADVRLKPGTADTPTTFRPRARELALAQRYYETGQSTIYAWTVAVGEDHRSTTSFKVSKHALPVITISAVSEVNVATRSAINETTERFDHRITNTVAGFSGDDSALWKAESGL